MKPCQGFLAIILCSLSLFAQDDVNLTFFAPSDNQYVLGQEQEIQLETIVIGEEPSRYLWDLGDGRTVEGKDPTVAWPEAGVYTVTLTTGYASGESGAPTQRWIFVNDAVFDVDIFQIPPFQFINRPEAGSTWPHGTAVPFEGHGYDSQGQAVTLYWDFDDGTVSSVGNGELVMHTYASSGTYNPKLFVRDESGFTQINLAFANISVYEGSQPPEGEILTPTWQEDGTAAQVTPETMITLTGQVVDEDPERGPYEAWWNVYSENGAFTLTGFAPEPAVWEPGYYEVFFHVRDNTREDPFPDKVEIWVRDSNRAPINVTISEPNYDPSIAVGERLGLSGLAEDWDGDELCYQWRISDGRTFEGQYVDPIPFNEPGLYIIDLTATDKVGGETTAEKSVYVIVYDPNTDCDLAPPILRAALPAETAQTRYIGYTQNFNIAIEPQDGEEIFEIIWDFSRGITASGMESGNISFTQGAWPVRVFCTEPVRLVRRSVLGYSGER